MPQTPARDRTPAPHLTPCRPGTAGATASAYEEVPAPPHGEPPGITPSRPEWLAGADAGEALSRYLQAWASEFLRSLRLHRESAGSTRAAGPAADAVRGLGHASRRLSGTLRTYRPLLDAAWADRLCGELRWLPATLSREYGHAARLDRLLSALHRLSGDGDGDGDGEVKVEDYGVDMVYDDGRGGAGDGRRGSGQPPGSGSPLQAGAARASALLERQLTLARARAHSAALQALGSNRFHAVVDAVAVLASEVPLAHGTVRATAGAALVPAADEAYARLVRAVGELPLPVPGPQSPYAVEEGPRPVTARTSRLRGDAAWHEVRVLLRLHRYAEEVLLECPPGPDGAGRTRDPSGGAAPDGTEGRAGRETAEVRGPAVERSRLLPAGSVLEEHREAVEAAEAAAAAARTPRIAPSTAYALGVLHADQRQAAGAARLAFAGLWRGGHGRPAP